ncbi:Membrane anchor Opy2, N-terminal [Penicillium italicum]|uniref:Membrane anchor Opy2, N-terminal n=1 Tax=Penicillium italicum TaxID=40296 RepID=A0A0A2L3F0_PENIT|nr:Membrane anchor Opy2, N-terminal [Penicillium italicum]
MLLEPMDSAFSPAHSLFKRCKQCETTSPACPSCPDGSICTMTAPSCDECATTKCVSTGSNLPNSGGTDTGAIAGGVIGGVAAIALVVFLVWWFAIRKKRLDRQEAEKNGSFAGTRSERQSIASTVLTRASNVIQIAYIPGVTNRSPPQTPASLVPPVPPLPGATPDQHFFMPGDLRDSSWTTTTGHQSISPTLRSSVATTIYRNDAIVSAIPAQQIQRSRAAVVSIHNGGAGSNLPGDDSPVTVTITPADAPAVPAITPAQLARAEAVKGNSSCVARSVTAKPVMVRGPSVKNKRTNNAPAVDRIEELSENSKSNNTSRAVSTTNSDQFSHDVSTFDTSTSSSGEDESHPSSSANLETGSSHRQIDARRASGLSDGRSSTRTPPTRVESPFSDANEVK